LTHPASKLSKTIVRLDAFAWYVIVVKRMKFETNLVFQIFFIVVYSLMDSHKDTNVNKFRIPTTKHCFEKGRMKHTKGELCSL